MWNIPRNLADDQLMPPIRIAIIGCGKFAGHHARKLSEHPEASVVACVDVTKAMATAFVAEHLAEVDPSPTVGTDVKSILAEVKPDAVVIATPHTLHAQHIGVALDAGCHVFVEKPMVTSAADARAIETRVASMSPQPIFVVGYNTVCTPEFDYLRRVIASPHSDIGLGELRMVNAWLSQNWLNWCRGSWRVDPKMSGGGFAYDTGAHLLSSLCFAVQQPVAQVFANIDQCGELVDINSSIHLQFKGNVTADLTLSGHSTSEGCRMTFVFEGGRIEIDGWYGSWIEVHNAWGRVKYPKVNTDLPSANALDQFINAIMGRDVPISGPALGVIQAELMDGIYASASQGVSISLPVAIL